MEILILGWYVLVTTGSVFWLTVIGALHFLGTLLSPGIGVVADRIGLRNALCLMRGFYSVMAGTLAFLFMTGEASLFLVFLIASLLGAVRPSDVGMRSALVAHTQPAQQLGGALALSRMTFDTARIAGALTGAGIFAQFGIGPAYVCVAVAYAAGCLLTIAIRQPARETKVRARTPFGDLIDGFRYVWQKPHLQAAMCLACLVNLTALPLSSGLLPYVAKNIYQIDQTGLGMLTASFASGALIGSLLLAVLRNRVSSGRLMITTGCIWHAVLIVFAFTTDYVNGMLLLFLAGFLQSLSMLSLAAILLKTTDLSMFGRVMGVRMLAIYSLPLGLLAAGALVPQFGYAATAAGYAGTGLALTLLVAVVWRRSIWAPSGVANG